MKPKHIKTAAAVLNQIPLDWSGNRNRLKQAIDLAREQEVTLLCLPELCLTGYGCEDAFHAPDTSKRALENLQRLLPDTKDMIVSFGLPLWHLSAVYTTACLVVDEQIQGFVPKRFLAGDGIHYEPRWFKPWPLGIVDVTSQMEQDFPLGDLIFEVGGLRIGYEICEDAWVPNRPGSTLALRGLDVILNPSASHFSFGKRDIRERFVIEGSRAFAVSYVYANLLGNEAGRAIYDGGALIASNGEMLARGPRFSYQDVGITTAVIDAEATRIRQARTTSFQPKVDGFQRHGIISQAFPFPTIPPTRNDWQDEFWETSCSRKEEEFTRAVSLSLFDYMRKSKSRGFVVSLSGGADSAAVACLCHLAFAFALKEIGAAGVREKMPFLKNPPSSDDPKDWTHEYLLTAYQSSHHSGPITRQAAAAVAKAIGAEHKEMDISSLVDGYHAMIEQAIGRPLDWKTDDIALQNIQARVRSPGIWMLTNLRGALLLSTSNRSEAAVGYATMDGDTSGGLSPIAGIDKAFLRKWLAWMETHGPEGLSPIPELNAVTVQAPTAELRPPEQKQTDEDDLMPYPVLDAIERAAIRDKQTPLEAWRLLCAQFTAYTPETLKLWTTRFFRLWSRNQWKRERYAPSFHLDDQNLDPKTWCRFPILSGGFEEELADLEKATGP